MRGRRTSGMTHHLTVETACRGLVMGMIRQAIRDLDTSTWHYDAAYWLENEGRAWAELIDINIDQVVKGQIRENRPPARSSRRSARRSHSHGS